ncbi:hypothetical protein GIB67_024487, partial [Kingdonia uniflora]
AENRVNYSLFPTKIETRKSPTQEVNQTKTIKNTKNLPGGGKWKPLRMKNHSPRTIHYDIKQVTMISQASQALMESLKP